MVPPNLNATSSSIFLQSIDLPNRTTVEASALRAVKPQPCCLSDGEIVLRGRRVRSTKIVPKERCGANSSTTVFMSFYTAPGRALLACGSLLPFLGLLFGGCNVEPAEDNLAVDAAVQEDGSTTSGDPEVVVYPPEDAGVCTRGVPRCVDAEHYRPCQDNGQWGEVRSCAGYAERGGGGNCADLPTAEGEPWAVCMEPACWHWLQRGEPVPGASVGICNTDQEVRPCREVGTFSRAVACSDACTRITTEDGVELGYCTPQAP